MLLDTLTPSVRLFQISPSGLSDAPLATQEDPADNVMPSKVEANEMLSASVYSMSCDTSQSHFDPPNTLSLHLHTLSEMICFFLRFSQFNEQPLTYGVLSRIKRCM